MANRSCTPFLWVGLIFWSLVCAPARADNIRPACLEIEELESGSIRVVWKVPRYQNIPDRFEPSFPPECRMTTPGNRMTTGSAMIMMWNMTCGEGGLSGARIGIDGLEQTMTEALVRIQLTDGSVHRLVLRPTQKETTIPDPASEVNEGRGLLYAGLGIFDRWRYLLLLPVAWFISLRPRARKRGILLCTCALVVGSLCGNALGRLPVEDLVPRKEALSEREAMRILQGLMLNTYRAFMLDREEEIYDYLARSVDGEFLNEIYLQNRQAMRMDETEGASTLVDRLDIRSIESMKRLKDGGIAMVVSWDVYGSVSHEGHIHYRCNSYKAELTILPTDRYWKLSRVQLLDEQRVI